MLVDEAAPLGISEKGDGTRHVVWRGEAAPWSSSSISVFTHPGQTALTRTPRPPHSAARVRVRPIRPCLLALYAARSEIPSNPGTELTFTMLPETRSSIVFPNSRHIRNGLVRLTASVRFQSSSVVSSAGTMVLIPALFTSTPTCPNSPNTASTIPRTAASSERRRVRRGPWPRRSAPLRRNPPGLRGRWRLSGSRVRLGQRNLPADAAGCVVLRQGTLLLTLLDASGIDDAIPACV